jgi:leucyl-tRNA synthetase
VTAVDDTLAPPEPSPAYDHRTIERRWQTAWQDADAYLATPASGPDDRSAYIVTDQAVPSLNASLELVRSYAISDSYARFMRARGASVLLALGFQAFGESVEKEAIAHNATPQAWVERCIKRINDQFLHLGFSVDFSRVTNTANSGTYQWSQLLFLRLLENGLVHRAENRWHLRFRGELQQHSQGSSALGAWNDLAVASQHAGSGQVDGVEFDMASLDGLSLTVFTTHAKAIKQAEFVAMSPNHPDIDNWISPVPGSDLKPGIALDTGRLVSGAGTDAPIPVIISAAVDDQFGPTAVLGIPAVDTDDADLASQLPPPAASAWKVTDKGPNSVRPAQRSIDRHVVISQDRGWGTPIPIINCSSCGSVPLSAEDLPLRLPEFPKDPTPANPLREDEQFLECSCPRCKRPARRETDTLRPDFDALWDWIAPCVQHISTSGLFDDPELNRWLPATQAVRAVAHSQLLLDQRASAGALRECGLLTRLPGDEPFAAVTMHERVQKGRPKELNHLDSLIKSTGADSARLMVLYGAAPSTVLTWRGHTLRYCNKWLTSFWDYAMPRLQKLAELPQIDDTQGAPALRRRLERWSRIAIERVTENYDALEMHRAIRNVMMLFVRIQDFEQRVIDRQGELTSSDERALAESLLIAVQLIAPVTPHIAEELWAAAGADGLLSAAPWPEIKPVVESV